MHENSWVVKIWNTSDNTSLGHHTDHSHMDLGQYNGPGEYCGPHTASSVFLILLHLRASRKGSGKASLHNDKDEGSNPAATRKKNPRNLDIRKAPCTEGALMVQQDLSGRPTTLKLN